MVAKHTILKTYEGLSELHNETQSFILILSTCAFIATLVGFCCLKAAKWGLNRFQALKSELDELKLRAASTPA